MSWSHPLPRPVCVLAAFASGLCAQRSDADWPQFRGPHAAGVRDGAALPVRFAAPPAWQAPIPGLAHASPVVADGRVFIATAVIPSGDPELKVGLYGAGDSAEDLVETEYRVSALDAASGDVLWNELVSTAVPRFARHTKATQVNATPAATARAVVAVLNSDLVCLDATSGEERWRVDLGPLDCGPHDATDLHWGYASSPIIAGDGTADERVIVQADVKGAPFLAAFALSSGEEIWRIDRDDVNTWCTPTVITRTEGVAQVLVNGCKHMGAYALSDGAELWRMAGSGGIPVPTPIAAGELAYFTANHRPLVSAHPLKPVYAVRLDARGDLGAPNVDAGQEPPDGLAWMATRRGNYMQSPLVYRGLLFLCSDSGVVTCMDATTGEEHFRERLDANGEGFTASPVAGDGKVYWVTEQGNVFVLAAKPELEIVARASLGDLCMATPAIWNGGLIFRLRHAVVRFEN